MKKIIDFFKKKWLKNTLFTVLSILIVVAIFVGINIAVEKANFADIDLTSEKLYSLSDESKDKLKDISQETKILLIGMQNYAQPEKFANLYNKYNEKITYEKIEDISKRPDLVAKYSLTTENSAVIVETSLRTKIVTIDQLYSYDYSTYQQIDKTEEALTNAILDVNLEKKPKVYFVTSHAKYANYTQVVKEYLTNEANEVEDLDILVKGSIPEDTNILVFTTLKEDITSFEKDLITQYINKGGKILMLTDPNFEKVELPNFQAILDLYGVKIDTGMIMEQDMSKTINGLSNIDLPNLSMSSDITKNIGTDGAVAFMNSGKLSFKSDEELENLKVKPENLVVAGSQAFFRTDLTQTSYSKVESDESADGAIMGSLLTKEVAEGVNSELIIYANFIFASDAPIQISNTAYEYAIYFYNNKDLVVNSISYLTDRKDNITIRKDTGLVTYTATAEEDRNIKIIIIALPILIVVIGIVIWQIRRRKK